MPEKAEKIALTHLEGQALMSKAHLELPDKMGGEQFDLETRSNAKDQITALRGALRAASPLVSKERRPMFGDSEAWEQSTDGKQWSMKRDWEGKTVEVELSEDALYGACWIGFIGLHPDCPRVAQFPGATPQSLGFSVAEADEIVWPLMKRLGWEGQLRRMLKIEKRRGMAFQRDGNGNGKAEVAKEERTS
jgi:hypothetical protein